MVQLLFAGALFPFAFSPVSLPGLAIISIAGLFVLLQTTKNKWQSFYHGWSYGSGLFGVGTSWIYISIHTYGHAEPWVAFLLTVLFCTFMGLYIACFTLVYYGLFHSKLLWIKVIAFSALWVIFEFIRANLFTGFPWLLLGFSQMETPMRYLAPIVGVYGLSFLVALSGCLLGFAIIRMKGSVIKPILCPLSLMLSLYLLPYCLHRISWSKPSSEKTSVSIIQGNINENEKWLPGAYKKTLDRYIELSRQVPKNTQIIVWPEGAIPFPYPQARLFLEQLPTLVNQRQATILAGIPYEHPKKNNQYYNAIVRLENNQTSQYYKHHLVPFGEYLPATVFREIAEYLHVAVYETARGEVNQPLLSIKNIPTLPFICYEIAYADILLKALPKVQLLLTISDDAWFGHSMARAQHLQMAQMRSLQSGRYQIVATNNGISAIINPKGDIIATVPSFETHILNSSIKAMTGMTPWAYVGDNLIIVALGLLCFLLLLI